MLHVLIDTSVWLDLAADSKQALLLRVLEDFIDNGALKLIVPRILHDVFHKSRDRIEKMSARRLASHFQQVKEAIKKVGADSAEKKQLLIQFDDVNHKLPLIGGAAAATLDSIVKILD